MSCAPFICVWPFLCDTGLHIRSNLYFLLKSSEGLFFFFFFYLSSSQQAVSSCVIISLTSTAQTCTINQMYQITVQYTINVLVL